jgi:hypothetical protein
VLQAAGRALAATARETGAAGEAVLAVAPLAGAERDTALRVLADTLCRVAGAAYPPRHAVTDRLLAEILAPGFHGATAAGCVIAPGVPGHVTLSREPAALPPPVPLEPGAEWDGRVRIEATEIAGTLGALGPEALAAMKRGDGPAMPPGWWKSPRPARLASPAIRDTKGRLLAVLAPGAGPPDGIAVQLVASGPLDRDPHSA